MQKQADYIEEQYYNTLATDFRVEAVAANLVKFHRTTSSIFIRRVGNNDRPYVKDLKKIYTNSYGLDEETLVLDTFRESIYDYLPEGLFHPPSLGNYSGNVESVIREIRKQKETEETARNFFQPFELEVFHTEITALLKEADFDSSDKSGSAVKVFSELWPLLKQVDQETAQTLLHILPFLHEVRGNKKWIETFLSAFLETTVTVDFVPNVIDSETDRLEESRLGSSRLGISTVTGGAHTDGEQNWRINIGPVPYSQIDKYVPTHPFRRLLQDVYEYLLPVTTEVSEHIITNQEDVSFRLSDELKGNLLGFSTFV